MRSATPPRPSPNRNIASGDTGFTLVELLVVVVIIAILAALGIPRLTRERLGREGRDFATLLTGELQRARIQAVATRLPQHCFVYANRIEVRSATPGSTPSAPAVAPTVSEPSLQNAQAPAGVRILDVVNATVTPTPNLSPTAAKVVIFDSMGVGHLSQPSLIPTPVIIYLENQNPAMSDSARRFRVEVSPLTGAVRLGVGW